MESDFNDLMQSPLGHVAYQAAVAAGSANAEAFRARLLADDKISGLIKELADWPGTVLSSHKSASQFYHKLVFLADIGLRRTDPGMATIIDRILASLDADGIPCLKMAIPEAYGGSGTAGYAWALCDAPSTLYALAKLGVMDDRVHQAAVKLAGFGQDYGFGCVVSPALGSWRGPGKKGDPCPYATLITLKLLLQFGREFEAQIKTSAACLLDLWQHSREKHPYIFYMGTDFRKLKLPFVWYDILHVTEVLSQVGSCRLDPRLQDMFEVIKAKEQAGGYTPESVWQPWKDWDFGQKKAASDWMNLCVRRIAARLSVN